MNFLERYLHKNSKLETVRVNFKRYQKYHNTQKLHTVPEKKIFILVITPKKKKKKNEFFQKNDKTYSTYPRVNNIPSPITSPKEKEKMKLLKFALPCTSRAKEGSDRAIEPSFSSAP